MALLEAAKRSLRAAQANAHLNSFISLKSEQQLLSEVMQSQTRLSTGNAKSAVDGQLLGVKDNICTTDLPTTCASHMLRDYISPFEATVVRNARQAGAVVMGKTNMDEFGMGSHSVHSVYGPVVRPGKENSLPRSAGGSSGGSAAAVAAGVCNAALGTDTGGSVRLPAAHCGIVGFKPSYGMLSRWGVVAYANSLDTVGIFGRRTSSVRRLFDAINGYDDNDPTSISPKTRERIQDRLSKIRNPTRRLRIGYPLEFNLKELTPAIRSAWEKTLSHFSSLSHEVIPVSLPTTKYALMAYYIIAPAEASSNLAKYDGVRYGHRAPQDRTEDGTLFAPTRHSGFGEEVRRRILLGAYTLSSEAIDNYFLKAQAVRRLIQRDFNAAFARPNFLICDQMGEDEKGGVDVLIAPCTLSTAPPLGEVLSEESPLDSYVNDVLTVPASLAGIPVACVPVQAEEEGRVEGEEEGLPVGMQVMAQYGDEETVWEAARIIEESLSPWGKGE